MKTEDPPTMHDRTAERDSPCFHRAASASNPSSHSRGEMHVASPGAPAPSGGPGSRPSLASSACWCLLVVRGLLPTHAPQRSTPAASGGLLLCPCVQGCLFSRAQLHCTRVQSPGALAREGPTAKRGHSRSRRKSGPPHSFPAHTIRSVTPPATLWRVSYEQEGDDGLGKRAKAKIWDDKAWGQDRGCLPQEEPGMEAGMRGLEGGQAGSSNTGRGSSILGVHPAPRG